MTVYNVEGGWRAMAGSIHMTDDAKSGGSLPDVRVKVGPEGRLLIPAAYRKALGLRAGDTVLLREQEGGLVILTAAQKRDRAREVIARYVSDDVSLADSLIEDRRAEAERESG